MIFQLLQRKPFKSRKGTFQLIEQGILYKYFGQIDCKDSMSYGHYLLLGTKREKGFGWKIQFYAQGFNIRYGTKTGKVYRAAGYGTCVQLFLPEETVLINRGIKDEWLAIKFAKQLQQ